MTIHKLKFNNGNHVAEVLADMADMDLDEVFVVAAHKGHVYIGSSGTHNMAKTLGDLEILKNHLLKHWD